METIVHYCGNDNYDNVEYCINALIFNLGKYTIEEKFFFSYNANYIRTNKPKLMVNMNPIKMTENGYQFFGNFEEYSYAFRIETSCKKTHTRLIKAIQNNKGWKKYYRKNKVEFNQTSLF